MRTLFISELNVKLEVYESDWVEPGKIFVAPQPSMLGALYEKYFGKLKVFMVVSHEVLSDEEALLAYHLYLQKEKDKPFNGQIPIDIAFQKWEEWVAEDNFSYHFKALDGLFKHAVTPPDAPNCRCEAEIFDTLERRIARSFGNTDPRILEFKR